MNQGVGHEPLVQSVVQNLNELIGLHESGEPATWPEGYDYITAKSFAAYMDCDELNMEFDGITDLARSGLARRNAAGSSGTQASSANSTNHESSHTQQTTTLCMPAVRVLQNCTDGSAGISRNFSSLDVSDDEMIHDEGDEDFWDDVSCESSSD